MCALVYYVPDSPQLAFCVPKRISRGKFKNLNCAFQRNSRTDLKHEPEDNSVINFYVVFCPVFYCFERSEVGAKWPT